MTDSLGKEGPSKQSKTLHTQTEEEEDEAEEEEEEEAPAEDPMAKLTPQELLAHQEVEQALQQGFSHAEEGLFTLSPLALRSLEQALQQAEAEKELQEKHHAGDVKEELGRK